MYLKYVVLSTILCISSAVYAQEFPVTEAEFDSVYKWRIQQEEIDGVYIPRNLEDAFSELKRLSPPESLQKYKSATEQVIRTKLHFGLGRWMIVNWGFYEGSRLSHLLKESGLEHPDDMARVILVCFHRHLNQSELKFEDEVTSYRGLRERERAEREAEKKVLSEEKNTRKER
jgi:hypothetical protein